MIINPTRYTNSMQHRKVLTIGQLVARNQKMSLDGFFDDVVSVVTAPVRQVAAIVSPIVSPLVSTVRDVTLAPLKMMIAVPAGIIAGAAGGRGISGAVQGANAGIQYSTGINLMPRPAMMKPIVNAPAPAPAAPSWDAPDATIGIHRPVFDTIQVTAPMTPNAAVGMQTAAKIAYDRQVEQASYGQLPYTPPLYGAESSPPPPPKKEVPWGAIATGTMAAATIISAMMHKA